MLKRSNFRGISMVNAVEVFLLMYADDNVLLGDTVLEIQKKINVLEKFCDKWGMEVNLTKTQVIVFRNGGKTSKSERFTYKSNTVKIVICYCSRLVILFFFKKYMVKSIIKLSCTSGKGFL